MSEVFPEVAQRQSQIKEVIRTEEVGFNNTLDRGVDLFRDETERSHPGERLSGEFAFKLYDTYGFPLDLTQLMAREQGLTVDVEGFETLMEQQRERGRKAQKKEEIGRASCRERV